MDTTRSNAMSIGCRFRGACTASFYHQPISFNKSSISQTQSINPTCIAGATPKQTNLKNHPLNEINAPNSEGKVGVNGLKT